MAIDVGFDRLPSDEGAAGPAECPPDRVASWLKSRLEQAQDEARKNGGRVIGFAIKAADTKADDGQFGTVVAPRDHLFVATEYPDGLETDVRRAAHMADLLGELDGHQPVSAIELASHVVS